MLILKIIGIVLAIIAAILLFVMMLVPQVIVKYNNSLGDTEAILKLLFVRIRLFPTDKKKATKKKRKKLKAERRKEARLREREAQSKAAFLLKGDDSSSGTQARKNPMNSKKSKKRSPAEKARRLAASIRLLCVKIRAAAPYLFSALSLDIKKLYISVGAQDAASCAISYGMICSALELLYQFEDELSHFSISEDVSVDVDFFSTEIDAEFEIVLKITLRKVLIALYRWFKTSITAKIGI